MTRAGILLVGAAWVMVGLALGCHGRVPAESVSPDEALYQACRTGAADACSNLAGRYLAGKPLPERRRVGRLYEGVCGSRHPADPRACLAGALYARACDQGAGEACATLGELVAGGRVAPGPAPAGALFARACRAGHPESCARVGAGQLSAGDPAAISTLEVGCRGGAGSACFALGRAHATGRGVSIDQAQARQLYARACTLDEGRGCAALAAMEARGLGGAVRRQAALDHWRLACDRGVGEACEGLGRHIEHGTMGLKPDPAAAFDLYRKARRAHQSGCRAADQAACGQLGQLMREGSGGPRDVAKGRQLQRDACRAGDAPSCLRVARGPSGGFDVGRVPTEAVPALTRACRGDGEACLLLALLGRPRGLAPACARGHGASCTAVGLGAFPPARGDRSGGGPPRAELLRRACDLGDANGCFHLAVQTARPGVDQDLEAALTLYRDACRWGSGPACTQLGISKLRGEGIALDPLAATSAFAQACRRGDPQGCAELGSLRLTGRHGKKDVAEAVRQLSYACRRGFGDGCARLGLAQLRGVELPRDEDAGRNHLQRGCEQGSVRACLDLAASSKDDERVASLRATAARRGRQQCQAAMIRCGGAPGTTVFQVVGDRVERRLKTPPACGGELERRCNDAREAVVAHCNASEAACWPAATFVRRLTGLGASLSEAEAQEKRAVSWARGACARGEARACGVMAEAHRAGRGGARRDDRAADRFRAKACKIDPAFCP